MMPALRLRPAAVLMLAGLLLAGCGGGGPRPYDGYDPNAFATAPHRYYAPPGTASDPWGPYIEQAAERYSLPSRWIRAVIHQESGGRQQAVSPVGAMGLMQLMPRTYAELRASEALGDDPYNPRDNILAGTAYLRRLYDRYGTPDFLAAYNAGPGRLDQYLAGNGALPDETVAYVAAIAPHLGPAQTATGPLAVYASARPSAHAEPPPTVSSLASGCDSNAAYDPDHPCAPLERAATAPARVAEAAPASLAEPAALAEPASMAEPAAQYAPPAPSRAVSHSSWAIQVGAFAQIDLARAMAQSARDQAAIQLADAQVSLPPTSPFGGVVLYRARLAGLSAQSAADACRSLNRHQLPCVVVRPGSW